MVWDCLTGRWQLILQGVGWVISSILLQQTRHTGVPIVPTVLQLDQENCQRGVLPPAATKHPMNNPRGPGFVLSAGFKVTKVLHVHKGGVLPKVPRKSPCCLKCHLTGHRRNTCSNPPKNGVPER